MHADWALLPRGHLPKRPNFLLLAEIELASSFVKLLLDTLTLLLMLLPVLVLTFLVAIPNALARRTLLEGIALLAARRTTFRGLIVLLGVLVSFGFCNLSLPRFAERRGGELVSSRRGYSVLFR